MKGEAGRWVAGLLHLAPPLGTRAPGTRGAGSRRLRPAELGGRAAASTGPAAFRRAPPEPPTASHRALPACPPSLPWRRPRPATLQAAGTDGRRHARATGPASRRGEASTPGPLPARAAGHRSAARPPQGSTAWISSPSPGRPRGRDPPHPGGVGAAAPPHLASNLQLGSEEAGP